MKALDVLVAARARLSDKVNWTTGNLFAPREAAKDGFCFCAMGATMKEGGLWTTQQIAGLQTLVPVVREGEAKVVPGNVDVYIGGYAEYPGEALLACIRAQAAVRNRIFGTLAKAGFQANATINAIKYLSAAARQITKQSDYAPFEVNDNWGWEKTIQMFDLAIKNAKHRHINGKHSKKTAGHGQVSV